jgi:gas vesicle protein
MRAASIHELKQELSVLKPNALVEICLRLGKFKKENKELLTYLLYEAHNEAGFISGVKEEISELFREINQSNIYWAKKSLRKIVRIINKYCRYSGVKESELELRIYFCELLIASGIPVSKSTVISNLYQSQLKKIKELMAAMHEDIQHDYRRQLEKIVANKV